MNPMGLCATWTDTYLHNCKPIYLNHQHQLDKLGRIELKIVNQLTMTGGIIQPEPSPQPSTNLQGKQICMSDLDMDHRQFANIPRTIYRIN